MEGGNALNNATTELAKAYYTFFSQYKLPDGKQADYAHIPDYPYVPAYADGMVPKTIPHPDYPNDKTKDITVRPPYVTYQIVKPAPLQTAILVVRVWVVSTSVTTPYTYIVDQVEKSIPITGVQIEVGDGTSVILRRGSPFSQDQPSDENDLKIRYINLDATYYGIN